MDKPEKISLLGLLFLALSLAGLLTYYRKQLSQPASESKDPFRSDHVAKIHIVMSDDNWQRLTTNAMAKPIVRADFWFDGESYKNVAVRTKGMNSLMTSQGSSRLPLKVDFNFFISAQTFHGIKKLCLNNGVSDPSFIREVLGYELFEQMGLPTPRRGFADISINDIHLGLYTIVEAVDKSFLRRNFRNAEGNLYKPETQAAALNWTKNDLDKQNAGTTQTSKSEDQTNLDIRIGGTRLGELITILQQEGDVVSEMLPKDASALSSGPFAGGQFPGPFPGDPNRPFPGGPGGEFPGGPRGPFAGDPNMPFPGGPGRQFSNDPNSPFTAGFRERRGFPGDPNRPFGGGFRARGGFPGGPGGMFGRGGNLIEQMGLKTNENYPDHSVLFNFLEVLNKCPDESFPNEVEKVLDVDGFLRFLAVSVLIVHLDNYIGMGHNYYLYEDNGKFCVIPWDLNLAFGTFGGGPGGGGPGGRGGGGSVNFYIDSPVSGGMASKPLVSRILAYKPYMDKYHQYLEQLLKGGFAEGVIEARIDELAGLIRPYVEADNLKFSTNEDFERSVSDNPASDEGGQAEFGWDGGRGGFRGPGPGGRGGRGGMNAPLLRTFIKQRRISVMEQLNKEQPTQSQNGNPEISDEFEWGFEEP